MSAHSLQHRRRALVPHACAELDRAAPRHRHQEARIVCAGACMRGRVRAHACIVRRGTSSADSAVRQIFGGEAHLHPQRPGIATARWPVTLPCNTWRSWCDRQWRVLARSRTRTCSSFPAASRFAVRQKPRPLANMLTHKCTCISISGSARMGDEATRAYRQCIYRCRRSRELFFYRAALEPAPATHHRRTPPRRVPPTPTAMLAQQRRAVVCAASSAMLPTSISRCCASHGPPTALRAQRSSSRRSTGKEQGLLIWAAQLQPRGTTMAFHETGSLSSAAGHGRHRQGMAVGGRMRSIVGMIIPMFDRAWRRAR